MQSLKVVLLEHHSGFSTKIRHGARGLLEVHTFFMIVVFSTKAEIPLDSWLLASSWLVIRSMISSCLYFQNELPPAEASAI
jgi:hypothetical protein